MTRSLPKISVVIPVYNGEDFIAKTLQGVLEQECPAHEVIVINDGSTDRTQDILDRFKGRITSRCIRNSGPGTARNLAMEMATGDYIALLDADDVWFRNKLKTELDYILRFPDIDFFCCNFAARYPHLGMRLINHFQSLPHQKDFNFDAPLRKKAFRLFLTSGNFVGTPSAVIFRKKTAEQAGMFSQDYKIVQDLDFFIQMSFRTNFVLISEVLFYKRSHRMNMSNDKIPLYLEHRQVLQDTIAIHQDFIRANGMRRECLRAVAELHYTIGNLYFESGKRGLAFATYLDALKCSAHPENWAAFLWTVSKKLLRMASSDRINRKTIRRWQSKGQA